MKKTVAFMLITIIFINAVSVHAWSFDDFLGTVGSVINEAGEALESVGQATVDAYHDVSEAVGTMWQDTTNFIDEHSKVVAEGVSNIYQNVSDVVGVLWQNTADVVNSAWNWTVDFTGEQSKIVSDGISNAISTVNQYVSDGATITEDAVKFGFNEALKGLNIAAEESEKIWNTVVEYSKAHNINLLTIAKLSLAIIARIFVGGFVGDMASNYINDILVGWFTTFDITSFDAAEAAMENLESELQDQEQDFE